MDFEIEGAELGQLLEAAAWTDAVTLTLAVTEDRIEVHALGHDREVRASVSACSAPAGLGEVQVPTKQLRRLLEGFREGRLRVRRPSLDSWLSLEQGTRRLRTMTRGEMIPIDHFDASGPSQVLDVEDWYLDANRLSWVTSEQAAGIREVAFEPDGAFALNARAVAWVKKPLGSASFVVPERLASAEPGRVTLFPTFAELSSASGAVYRHTLPAVPIFRRSIVDHLFASDVVVSGTAPVAQWVDCLRAIGKHEKDHRVRLSAQGRALQIRMIANNSSAEDFLDLREVGQPFSCYLDGMLLADAVAASQADEIEFGRVLFPQLPHPLVWLGTPSYCAILAPMTEAAP